MTFNPLNCYAYVERTKNGTKVLGQCLYKKADLTNDNCLFCEKHQNIYNKKGQLKNGHYIKKQLEFSDKAYNINTDKKYTHYSKFLKELKNNSDYGINKLKKMKNDSKFC